MDSGNSGSMQSSSCGEEEFDSRADSISSFFNSSSAHVASNISPNQPPPPPPPHQSSLFDPLSTYLDVFSRPTPPTNPHLSWPISHGSAAPPAPSPATQPQLSGRPPNFLFNQSSSLPNIGTTTTANNTNTLSDQNATRPSTNVSSHHDPNLNPVVATRNPKKRSRASRRAPTTVLTTDTSNFRAMVQEFTGIPAPPFSSSASLPFPHRSRLDLFGGGGSGGGSMPPSYLLRPFAHKPQPPPTFLSHPHSNISSHDHTNTTSTTTSTSSAAPPPAITSNASNSSSNSSYQLPSELGLLPKQQNLVLNMQSSTTHENHHQHPTMLSFQSLLQSPPTKHNSSSDVPLFAGLKSHQQGSSTLTNIPSSLDSSRLKVGVMEELGGVSSTHQLINTDNWVGHEGVGSNNDGDHHHQMSHLRGFNGNFGGSSAASQRVNSSSCKMNFSASSSDFHADHHKGSESVPARGEGMVDSWICPSD